MAHNPLLFRSDAREDILRGAIARCSLVEKIVSAVSVPLPARAMLAEAPEPRKDAAPEPPG